MTTEKVAFSFCFLQCFLFINNQNNIIYIKFKHSNLKVPVIDPMLALAPASSRYSVFLKSAGDPFSLYRFLASLSLLGIDWPQTLSISPSQPPSLSPSSILQIYSPPTHKFTPLDTKGRMANTRLCYLLSLLFTFILAAFVIQGYTNLFTLLGS